MNTDELLSYSIRHFGKNSISEVNDNPNKVIKRVGLVREIGRAQVCRQFDQAIERAKQLIQTV